MYRPRRNVFGFCSPRLAIFAATLCLILALTQPAQAKTFHCGAGDVACLIAAINEANANGHENTIHLETGVYTLTDVNNQTNGANGLPAITSPLTIKGAGADVTTITRTLSPPQFNLMYVGASGNLTLEGVTLSGASSGFDGAGLSNDGGTVYVVRSAITGNLNFPGLVSANGTLSIAESRVSGNLALGTGGMVLSGGAAFITKSTFDGNVGQGVGAIALDGNGTLVVTDSAFTGNIGAIAIGSGSTAIITNTTFARNSGLMGTFGVAIDNSGTLRLKDVTFAENTSVYAQRCVVVGCVSTLLTEIGATTILQNTILASGGSFPIPGCHGPVTSLGHNLIEDPTGCNITLQLSDLVGDPGLDTFEDNGKPGNGHYPLLPTSRAIDTGALPCPRRDQIGQRRINECDTGAIAFHDGVDALQ